MSGASRSTARSPSAGPDRSTTPSRTSTPTPGRPRRPGRAGAGRSCSGWTTGRATARGSASRPDRPRAGNARTRSTPVAGRPPPALACPGGRHGRLRAVDTVRRRRADGPIAAEPPGGAGWLASSCARRISPERVRGTPPRRRRPDGRLPSTGARACTCSTGRATPATTARCSRSRASMTPWPRGSSGSSRRRSTTSTWTPTRASTHGSARST